MRQVRAVLFAGIGAIFGGAALLSSDAGSQTLGAQTLGAQTLGPAAAAPTLPSTINGPANLTGGASAPSSSLPRAGKPDIAFGAFQRGYYVTAMQEAMKRVEANPNDGPAMTLIAELYAQGLGVRSNPAEAAHWLQLGVEHGDRQATFALGLAELKGDGVPKDRDGAQALFQKAAAQNHPGALYNLGVMAIENNGVVPDFSKAARYFKQAADFGDADASYALGILFRNGTGVEKSDKRAAEWIGKSAEEGNVPAITEYAIMMFNGAGINKDEEGAAKLFLKAAAHNNPVAQNRIARMLAAGRGIKQNMVEAIKWHVLARTAGLDDTWLDSKLEHLSPEDKAAVAAAVRQYIGN